MFYGIIQLGASQYGGSYNASGTRTVTVSETVALVETIEKQIQKTVLESVALSEEVQKTMQTNIAELLSVGDFVRIFVEGNDVTYWSRTERDDGVWSPLNKQY